MKRKGIPKKRIGPEAWSWERSIRKRHIKVTEPTLNAAERSTYSDRSVSLCGIKEEKKEKNNRKEVKMKKIVSLSGSQGAHVRGKWHRQSFTSQDARVRGSL